MKNGKHVKRQIRRNLQKEVRELEYENGRLTKGVEWRTQHIATLERLNAGFHEALNITSAWISYLTVLQATQSGGVAGTPLVVPAEDIAALIGKYDVRTTKDESGNYVLTVVPKEEGDGDGEADGAGDTSRAERVHESEPDEPTGGGIDEADGGRKDHVVHPGTDQAEAADSDNPPLPVDMSKQAEGQG